MVSNKYKLSYFNSPYDCCFSDNLKNSTKPRGGGSLGRKNVTLLARYCKEHKPKSCEHSLFKNATYFPRPCSLLESYLTSGDSLTLELKLGDSTALRWVKLALLMTDN